MHVNKINYTSTHLTESVMLLEWSAWCLIFQVFSDLNV